MVAKFIFIVSGITLATLAGYLFRRLGLLAERRAGSLMFYTVLFGWTPVSALVLWKLPLQASLIVLPMMSVLLAGTMAPIGIMLAKLHKLDNKTAGTFAVSCGISNVGFTMGGFICYCMFNDLGLGYAQLYTLPWALIFAGIFYPIARRFGEPDAVINVAFILRTIFDRRAMPVLGAITGLTLNFAGVTQPEFIAQWRIIDVFMVCSVLFSFFNMGLQLHFTFISENPKLHFTLAGAKFLIAPLVTLFWVTVAQLIFGNLPEIAYKVVLIEGFMPAAIFSVIISNLFHLNPRLASILFVFNTAFFLIVILPILISVFG